MTESLQELLQWKRRILLYPAGKEGNIIVKSRKEDKTSCFEGQRFCAFVRDPAVFRQVFALVYKKRLIFFVAVLTNSSFRRSTS